MLAALTLVFAQWDTFTTKLPDVRELLQLADPAVALAEPGDRQGHPRVRPRPDGQALRLGSPRDGHALPRAHAGAVLRRDRQLAPAEQVEADLDRRGRHLRRVLPGVAGHLRLVEHAGGAAQQPDALDDVHLLGEHDPLQRQPAAAVRRLLRHLRLPGDPQPPDQVDAVLRLPVPGEGARAGGAGPELHAAVAAGAVRDLRDRVVPLPLVHHLQHHLLPVPLPAREAPDHQRRSSPWGRWCRCWSCRCSRSSSSSANPGGCAK